MSGFGVYKVKDIDHRHWTFAQQQKDMSCGPTSVKIAKELYHNKTIGEEVIRGQVGMQHTNTAHSGQSLIDSAAATDYIWRLHGSIEDRVLPAVKHNPLGIPHAKFAHGIPNLRSSSRNHPAILGFNWDGGGGHFVVCVGPTTTDPSLFVILDPDDGMQYLSADDAVGNALFYNPTYGQRGQIDDIGFIVT